MCELNKPLTICTLGEFAEALAIALMRQQDKPQKEHTYKGIKGIQEIFGCGESKARSILRSGKIDPAITRLGARLFTVDPTKAKSLINF